MRWAHAALGAWVCGVSVAQAEDAGALVRTASLAYPRHGVVDASVVRSCAVRIVLGERGRPTEIAPTTCDPAVQAVTLRRVARWRWDPSTPPGAVVDAEVRYAPPLDEAPWPTAQTWRRMEGPTCAAHLAVAPDHHAHLRRTSDDACRPVWSGELPTLSPEAQTARPAMGEPLPRACAVTFLVRDGRAFALDLFRCDPVTRDPARAVLSALTFPAAEGVAPWSMWIEFSPRDRADEPIVEPAIVWPVAP